MLKVIGQFAVGVVLFLGVTSSAAQTSGPTETRNAALRYWLAFADLQDPPADKSVADLLEKTAAGEAAWDEEKLGPILTANEDAIARMQRATKLPDCDWGLEYDLGPFASVAYISKARVLARLDTLEGMRLAAKGDTQKAVDTWLAGIRFSQDVAKGGTLIFSLVAKRAMTANFKALEQAAEAGKLSVKQKQQIETVVRSLPEDGLDWSKALWYEQDPLDIGVTKMAAAADPAAYYRGITGSPAPEGFTVPTSAEIAAYHKIMERAEEALRLPPKDAEEPLTKLQESMKTLHPFFRDLTPRLPRLNESRLELEAARRRLLHSLSAK
jgi:hypothetical protein